MSESHRLNGKVAVVTGASSGIGRAIAEVFARESARVVLVDRQQDSGEEIASRIRAMDGEGVFLAADVSDESDVNRVVRTAVDQYSRLDVLVNCAGIALGGTVVDTDSARWQRVIDVNLAGSYLTCRLSIPQMIDSGGGSIVNVASLQGMYGYPGWAAYAASKAGLIGLTRQIAVDFADHGVRCNAISPGAIYTELGSNTAKLEPGFARERERGIDDRDAANIAASRPKMLRPGRPEHVANAALFLASDESAHITGHNLVVDGGASARVE